MFEKLDVPNVYFIKNPVLSCFATGIFKIILKQAGHQLQYAIQEIAIPESQQYMMDIAYINPPKLFHMQAPH